MKRALLLVLAAAALVQGDPAVTPLQKSHIAEIATNVTQIADPATYPRLAYELGRYPCLQSLEALMLMLEACNGKGDMNQSILWRDNAYRARAYVLYALARIGAQYLPGRKALEANFEISRPLGMALLQTKGGLMPLLQKEVGFLMDKYTTVSSDQELYQMKRHIPGSVFILENCPDVKGLGIRYEEYMRILEATALLEATKSEKALPLLTKMLGSKESRYWEKPVFRAVHNLKVSDEKKLEFYAKAYALTRNMTQDKPPVNPKAEPDFDIRNVSGEAHLIFLISQLDVPFDKKIPFYEKSLASRSYTARAAVVDSMVRERMFDKLAPIFGPRNRDISLKEFTIYRLGYDSAAGAKDLLVKLSKSGDQNIAKDAQEALKIK